MMRYTSVLLAVLAAGCANPLYSEEVTVLDKATSVSLGRSGPPPCPAEYSCDVPPHPANLQPFSLDRTEITVGQYRACVQAGACPEANGQALSVPVDPGRCNGRQPDRDRYPMNCLTQRQAGAFCAWLGRALPSEDQWEYAAGPAPYPFGSEAPDSGRICWRREDSCPVDTLPRTLRGQVSDAGLADLAGNVWEWTVSRGCPASDLGCETSNVIVRGGSWDYGDDYAVRSTARLSLPPDFVSPAVGARCGRSL